MDTEKNLNVADSSVIEVNAVCAPLMDKLHNFSNDSILSPLKEEMRFSYVHIFLFRE